MRRITGRRIGALVASAVVAALALSSCSGTAAAPSYSPKPQVQGGLPSDTQDQIKAAPEYKDAAQPAPVVVAPAPAVTPAPVAVPAPVVAAPTPQAPQ